MLSRQSCVVVRDRGPKGHEREILWPPLTFPPFLLLMHGRGLGRSPVRNAPSDMHPRPVLLYRHRQTGLGSVHAARWTHRIDVERSGVQGVATFSLVRSRFLVDGWVREENRGKEKGARHTTSTKVQPTPPRRRGTDWLGARRRSASLGLAGPKIKNGLMLGERHHWTTQNFQKQNRRGRWSEISSAWGDDMADGFEHVVVALLAGFACQTMGVGVSPLVLVLESFSFCETD